MGIGAAYDFTNRLTLTVGLLYNEDGAKGDDLHTQLADYDRNPVSAATFFHPMIAPGNFSKATTERWLKLNNAFGAA